MDSQEKESRNAEVQQQPIQEQVEQSAIEQQESESQATNAEQETVTLSKRDYNKLMRALSNTQKRATNKSQEVGNLHSQLNSIKKAQAPVQSDNESPKRTMLNMHGNTRASELLQAPVEIQDDPNATPTKEYDLLRKQVEELRASYAKSEARNAKLEKSQALTKLKSSLWDKHGDRINPKMKRLFNGEVERYFVYDDESGSFNAIDEFSNPMQADEWFEEFIASDDGEPFKKTEEVKQSVRSLGARKSPEDHSKKKKNVYEARSEMHTEEQRKALNICRCSGGVLEYHKFDSYDDYLKHAAKSPELNQKVLDLDAVVYLEAEDQRISGDLKAMQRKHGFKIT